MFKKLGIALLLISVGGQSLLSCQIQDKVLNVRSGYIILDDTTNCNRGKISAKFYDGDTDQYLGNDQAIINNGAFKIFLRTPAKPKRVRYSYSIKEY